MKIERHDKPGLRPYYTVLVAKDELVVASGKTLPYSTWIGTIQDNGKITVWTPAAPKPRGYHAAALRMLEEALEQVKKGAHDVND